MLAALALLAAAAQAEDSVFAGTTPDDPEKEPKTHLSAEFGGTYTSGNTAFYAVNGLVKADHYWSRNMVSGNGGILLGGAKTDLDADGLLNEDERAGPLVENARRAWLEAKYDRFVSDHDSFYVLAAALHDPFAGYDLRSHEQVGYARLFVKEELTEFKGEIGFDVAQEDYVDGIDPNYEDVIAARVLLGFRHAFNENVGFSETFEVYENLIDFDDVRLLNTVSFTSQLNGQLALKLSNTLIYDNVPVEGYAPLDQTSMVTLVATIL